VFAADRRYPYTPFDPALIRAFLDGRDVRSAELLLTGKTNTNYRLVLSDGCTCVLRLHSRGGAEREARIMELVRDRVPVPRVLACGEAWSVLSFLAGGPLAGAPQCCRAAAEALGRIGTVTFDSPGWVNADGTVSLFAFEGGKGFVESLLERADVRTWLSEDMIAGVLALHRQEAGRFAEMAGDCRLVHGDYNPTNILVRDGVISGILDWEWAHSNTPYMDIGNLLRNTDPRYHDEIRRGLEAGGMRLPRDWSERAELIDLSSHLEFLASGRSDAFKRQCVVRIAACLARFGCEG
jgi:Ser/Thr protein kinase RdoA (MazF antagonist)